MRRIARAVAALLGLCALGPVFETRAAELHTGRLPIKIDAVQPIALAPDDELRIEGTIEADENVVVVLRIDDMTSWDYASRFNGERTLPPGPFRWTLAAKGLRTTNGRFLDHTRLRRVIAFVGKGQGRATFTRFETAKAPRLPEGAVGFSLGSDAAEVPAGFERLTASSPAIAGRKVFAVHRPAPDPLVASGLRGVERVVLPWQGGRAHVTLWTEDPGEWEMLPHPLERRIRVNGAEILAERMTPQEWIERRYLRGSHEEHDASDDAWTAYGRRRGERRSIDVEPTADGIVVELAGSGAEALFLSAVLIEPAGATTAADWVEDRRAAWYRSTWPVVAAPRSGTPDVPLVEIDGPSSPAVTLNATAPAGSGAHLTFRALSRTGIAAPRIALEAPSRDGTRLTSTLWAAQTRLERRSAGDTVLSLADSLLSGDPSRSPLRPGLPRTYELWIDVPRDAAPGAYHGSIALGSEHARATVPIEIRVPALTLPPAPKPAGFYLDEVPHLSWFATKTPDRARQAVCDLALMSRLGLAGTAPALATPRPQAGGFEADMQRAAAAGLAAPWLAYAPAKRLLQRLGADGSAAEIARLEGLLRDAGLVPPLWSLADEPSNPDQNAPRLADWIAAIRAKAPGARIAAQLNTPGDRRLVADFDTVLLNNGYGLDAAVLEDAAATGREVWIYNTERPRLTAGLWLWRTPARRYLQWHARMPTADPFDPTDGREGDVQAILPGPGTCPPVPTINRALLDMADGVVDQRWLAWAELQDTGEARALLRDTRRKLGARWRDALTLTSADLQALRESLIKLAAGTQ